MDYWNSENYKTNAKKRFDVAMELLNEFGENIKNKKIIEFGAGHGYFGELFENEGAIVESSDARREFVNVMTEKYSRTIFQSDVDLDIAPTGYDIAIAFGLLYHIENPINFLRTMTQSKLIILETAINNSEDSNLILQTNDVDFNQSLSGLSFYPSRKFIEDVLKKLGYAVMSKEVKIDGLKRRVFVARKND